VGEGVFLGQLQAFLEVARLGNVTRAADSLFLTQPALSARLKRLEQEVGATLLLRDYKGARLTEAGRAFLPYAERAVSVMMEAHDVVTDAREGTAGELALATTQTLNTSVLPPVINRFVRANPSVRLSVRTAPSEQIMEMVLSGAVHLGLSRSLQDPQVESVPLYNEEYIFVVGAHHPLADAKEMTVADLAGEIIVTLFRSPTFQLYVEALLRRNALPAPGIIDLDNPATGKEMLKEGIGVGLIPRTAAAPELEDGSLRRIEIADVPGLRRTMVALRLRTAPEQTSTAQFLDFLGDRLRELGLAPQATSGAATTPDGAAS
jgi:DNA-binding transcriptional LysR family regulator